MNLSAEEKRNIHAAIAIASMWRHRGVGNTTLMMKGLANYSGPQRPVVIARNARQADELSRADRISLADKPRPSPIGISVERLPEALRGVRAPAVVDHAVMADILMSLVGTVLRLQDEIANK